MIKNINNIKIWKAILTFFIFVMAIAMVHILELDQILNTSWIDAHIRNHGWQGAFLYIVLVAFFTALAVPRQLMSFLGGYAFGAVFGTLWATLGATMGCIIAFYYARVAARDALQQRFGRHVAKFDTFFACNPLSMSIVIRCLPLGNNLVTSMTAGVSSVPAPQFFMGSCIGYIPQNAIFALLGSGISVSPITRTITSAVLFIISSILGYYLFKKYRGETLLQNDIKN